MKKARVLSVFYVQSMAIQPNTLLQLDDAKAESLEESGVVCTKEASIAYCEKELGLKAVTLASMLPDKAEAEDENEKTETKDNTKNTKSAKK